MKSRINKPELKTIIYEQPGEISELKANALTNLILAYAKAHPELREQFEKEQQGEPHGRNKNCHCA